MLLLLSLCSGRNRFKTLVVVVVWVKARHGKGCSVVKCIILETEYPYKLITIPSVCANIPRGSGGGTGGKTEEEEEVEVMTLQNKAHLNVVLDNVQEGEEVVVVMVNPSRRRIWQFVLLLRMFFFLLLCVLGMF